MRQDYSTPMAYCHALRTGSLYGFLFMLPISIAFSQMCLTGLFVSYLIEILLTHHLAFRPNPLNRPLFAYLVVTIGVTPFSLDVVRSARGLEGLIPITVFSLISHSIQNTRHLKRCAAVLLCAVTLTAVYGVIQYALKVDIFRLSRPISFLKHLDNDLNAPVRIPGFTSYMTFSGQLAMSIPLLLALLTGTRTRLKTCLVAGALLLTCCSLLWTYTRSAWLGAVCAVTLIGLARGKKYWYIFLLLFALVTLIAVQPGMLNTSMALLNLEEHDMIDRVTSTFSAKENRERLYTWESTLSMIRDYPLTGIGKGNYSTIADAYRHGYTDFTFSSRAHAHNNLLQIAVEGGIVSLLCFLWLWGVIFQTLYRTYRTFPESRQDMKLWALGCFGALVAFFVHGFFEYNFGDAEVAMMMWTIMAFAIRLFHVSPNSFDH